MKKILLIFVIVLFNVSYLYSKTTIEEDFLSYVVRGDAKKVLYYINDEDVNINYRDVNGVTPLMLSIIAKQNEITQILIKNGANLDLKDNKGFTALLLAVLGDNTEAVRMLINAGANVNAIAKINNVDYTVLDLAKEIGNKTIINMLLSAGAK